MNVVHDLIEPSIQAPNHTGEEDVQASAQGYEHDCGIQDVIVSYPSAGSADWRPAQMNTHRMCTFIRRLRPGNQGNVKKEHPCPLHFAITFRPVQVTGNVIRDAALEGCAFPTQEAGVTRSGHRRIRRGARP